MSDDFWDGLWTGIISTTALCILIFIFVWNQSEANRTVDCAQYTHNPANVCKAILTGEYQNLPTPIPNYGR